MRALFLTLFVSLYFVQITKAQSGLLIRGHTMQPASDIFNKDVSSGSFGVNLGYRYAFKSNHLSIDLTGFFDAMDYKFDIGLDKRFKGYTYYTGASVGPRYCFNPNADVQFSIALYIKDGHNWGDGFVYQGLNEDEGKQIESKSASAGNTVAYSPVVSLTFPVEIGSVGIELGYDSSNYGTGIGKLRSQYYQPITYHSGYMFVGVFFRFGD